jgi:tetratricopeptide (TPR) repeat protein
VFLKPGESKTINLTLGPRAAAASAPQFFDEPQFTVAGVTDTTNLGGHGSDTVVRARDSLAKDTALLGEIVRGTSVDATREQALRQTVERQPSDLTANQSLGQLLVATGRAREAIPLLERAAALNPANYENSYDLALANAEAGNYTVAKGQATKLLAKNDNADLHHLLGDLNEKLGDSLEAVRHYQRAAELDPSEPHLFDWGAELLLHHAPEPAIEVFSRGNRLFPSSMRMLLGLGAAYFARGAYDDAVLHISQASDLNQNDPVPYGFLCRIEQVQNTLSADLVEKLHRFVTLQPQNADANYYYAVGLWKLRKSRPETSSIPEVESLLKTAIQINPKHAAAALQLGIVHSEERAHAQAIADFQKALESDPQMQEAHYRLAQSYRQIGEFEKAKEQLRFYNELAKQSAQQQDRERREIKQFVYTLRDKSSPHAQ